MNKTLQEITVYTNNEYICILQPSFCGENPVIAVHPEQIDVLIQWLQEAKKEFTGEK